MLYLKIYRFNARLVSALARSENPLDYITKISFANFLKLSQMCVVHICSLMCFHFPDLCSFYLFIFINMHFESYQNIKFLFGNFLLFRFCSSFYFVFLLPLFSIIFNFVFHSGLWFSSLQSSTPIRTAII